MGGRSRPVAREPRDLPVAESAPPAELRWIEWATRLLDDAFRVPGTRWRFGLDPLLGLIPGVGDGASAVTSVAILGAALRLGVPRLVLARMGLNVAFDYLLGLVPVLGDVADAFLKSNRRNLTLLRAHAMEGRRPGAGDYLVVGGVVAVIALSVAVGLTATVWLLRRLVVLLTG